jgi:hypothetical protein
MMGKLGSTAMAKEGSSSSEVAGLENSLRCLLGNPYLVLELPPSADGAQVERQAKKLLGMLATQMAEAQSYPTPLGRRERTPELVRTAMAELDDPDRRLVAEWWMAGWGARS